MAAVKEYILARAQETVETKIPLSLYCRVVGISRGLFYRWKRRALTGQLENFKPIARNIWWQVPEAFKQQVIRFALEHPQLSSCCVLAKKFGISSASAWRILIKNRIKTMKEQKEIKRKEHGFSEWLKIHACWSVDAIHLRFMGGRLYLILVLEEYSRLILGWKLCADLTSANATELIQGIIQEIGIKPLVIKHDQGKEFMGSIFQGFLKSLGIIPLPSPAYYAPFNGRLERMNRLIRRFTRPFEEKIDTTLAELESMIKHAVREINDYLPRLIFDGLTSREVYEQKEVYTEQDRENLLKLIPQEQARLEETYSKKAVLDRHRTDVVKALRETKLCEVQFGKNVRRFPRGFVR